MRRASPLLRLSKWTAVGSLGLVVKLGAAAIARELFGLHYVLATAAAVEATLLHNFCWHHWWTWRDRSAGLSCLAILTRVLRFHASTGIFALAVNVLLVRVLVEHMRLHYLEANLLCVPLAGVLNFLTSEFLVFVARPGRS